MSTPRILVAEDSPEVRLAIEDALAEEGYEVMAAAHGQAALDAFAQFRPDLAVLDLRLPDMSGADICRLIKAQSKIPVLIFSAVEEQSEKQAALERGADDYIVKRGGLVTLLTRVDAHLNRKRTT